jgi:hypothetical protein
MKRIYVTVLIVLVLALGATAVVLATNAGTQEDPLVTVSYLNDKFKADIIRELEAKITEQGTELSRKIDEKLGTTSQAQSAPADAYFLVALTRGQTLTCEAGTEVLPREGVLTIATAPVTDATTGAELAVGGTAAANHMYLASARCGFTVTSDTATVLVRGKYTLG